MDIKKELERHAKEVTKVHMKYFSRFRHAYDQTINAKARNTQSIDKIVADNVILDKQITELNAALSITDQP